MDIRSSYTTRIAVNDTLTVELIDEAGFAFDNIDFPHSGGVVHTPAGYENTVGGAHEYARATWRLGEKQRY